jgi:hypothetical protein
MLVRRRRRLAAVCAAAATAAAALVVVPAGLAAPAPALGPGADVTTIVAPPTPISPLLIPGAKGPLAGANVQPADCGACIVTCWGVSTRSGISDGSGHAWIWHHIVWCGNGAVITYAVPSQSLDQSGWYTIGQSSGPSWTAGCVGCSTIRASGWMLWNWSAPLISLHHSGTSHLDTTVTAWGSAST